MACRGSVHGLQRCVGCFTNASNVGAGNVRRTGGAATKTALAFLPARGSGAAGPGRRLSRTEAILQRVAERWPGQNSKFWGRPQDIDAGSQLCEQRVVCAHCCRLRTCIGHQQTVAAPALAPRAAQQSASAKTKKKGHHYARTPDAARRRRALAEHHVHVHAGRRPLRGVFIIILRGASSGTAVGSEA